MKECSFEDTNIVVRVILKLMLRWDGKLWTCGLDLSGCEQVPVVCCCEHHNEWLGCIMWMNILTGLTMLGL